VSHLATTPKPTQFAWESYHGVPGTLKQAAGTENVQTCNIEQEKYAVKLVNNMLEK
jgi:hypothetical protein